RALFLASLGLTLSPDTDKHGIFTEVLLDGLKGAADREGYEPDGSVTVDELREYVDKELPERTQKLAKADKAERMFSHAEVHSSHFVITHNPSAAAKTKEHLDKFAQLAAGSKLPEEWTSEGERLLSRMPKLKAQQELRRAYEQLAEGKLGVDAFKERRDEIVASTKLKKQDAVSYANKVVQATQVLRDGYVKEVNQGQLTAWGLRGLYKHIDEPIPADIRERLDKAKDMGERDLHDLLVDARERLGNRDDLDQHKDLDYTLQRMTIHLDPYTTYIDPDTLNRFTTETTGKFHGIGISIREDREKNGLRVI